MSSLLPMYRIAVFLATLRHLLGTSPSTFHPPLKGFISMCCLCGHLHVVFFRAMECSHEVQRSVLHALMQYVNVLRGHAAAAVQFAVEFFNSADIDIPSFRGDDHDATHDDQGTPAIPVCVDLRMLLLS